MNFFSCPLCDPGQQIQIKSGSTTHTLNWRLLKSENLSMLLPTYKTSCKNLSFKTNQHPFIWYCEKDGETCYWPSGAVLLLLLTLVHGFDPLL